MKMVIHGYEVTEAQQAAALQRMRQGPFKANDITQVFLENGVPEFVVPPGKNPTDPRNREFCATRASDRLFRAEKREGRIVWDRGEWRPHDGKPAASLPAAAPSPRRRRSP